MSKFTVDYFIEKFKSIPAKRWVTRSFENSRGRCVMGHCGRDNYFNETPESIALSRLFNSISESAMDVNDEDSYRFPQLTPKKRILAALKTIKEIQNAPK